MEAKLISVVVPCYNEAATVPEFYRRIKAVAGSLQGRSFEFLFVNDGSSDHTGRVLNDLASLDPRVRVIHLARNRGHQIALTAGIDHAAGDVIVTMDADLQHPPEVIPDLIHALEQGHDIVHAQRRIRTGDSWFKLLTAKLFYLFMRFFSGVKLIENCGDFRAFTKPVQQTVIAFRTPHQFLRGTFVQVGFRQAVIQYDGEARFGGETGYSLWKMVNLAIDGVLGFSATPIRIITWLSLALWAMSLIHLGVSLYDHFVSGITVPGWTSIITLMFFFTGLVLFSIAVIGSYVGRIFQQGQNNPLYWVCDLRNLPEDAPGKEGSPREVLLAQHVTKTSGAIDEG
ncbi:MAG TPA: glycosyltransferase family 2 protein [Deltaproteobacteria bacterium]|nr:glycosyltransferase family 2 protein [Deltaproteobacteria bacterium]HQI80942.1 glycosyltransferase family 2 protein [Deltaproteobacteria bacterium]